jgi:hypothetical protein
MAAAKSDGNANGPSPERGFSGLRVTALILVLAGAIASIGFTLQVGQRNRSVVLVSMFVVWVLSPFAALAWANLVANRWASLTQKMLFGLTLGLALGSVALYAKVALGAPSAKPAFVFLVVPFASWLMIAGAAFISGLLSRRRCSV